MGYYEQSGYINLRTSEGGFPFISTHVPSLGGFFMFDSYLEYILFWINDYIEEVLEQFSKEFLKSFTRDCLEDCEEITLPNWNTFIGLFKGYF